jgi:hypothetical protein
MADMYEVFLRVRGEFRESWNRSLMRKDISERVIVIGHHGHAQAKRTSDAGGTAKTLAVSSARAVHADAPEANRKTEQKPAIALSLMSFNANRRNHFVLLVGNCAYLLDAVTGGSE